MKVRIKRLAGIAGSLFTAVVVMFVLGAGLGPLPALGQALSPGQGVWPSGADAQVAHTETIDLPNLHHPVRVGYSSDGVPAITAADDNDLFLAQGYVTAEYRLSQMDLARRLGEGQLAALDGGSAIDSDVLELTLGLRRTAEATWAATPRDSAAGQALTAYSQGVNDRLKQLADSGEWPTVYGLTGVRPAPWTPVDSLVVQGVLTQELSYSTGPLTYALLSRSLGAAKASQWFPLEPANAQNPYDPGPYRNLGLAPLTSPNANAAAPTGGATAGATTTAADVRTTGTGPATEQTAQAAQAAQAILASMAKLPPGSQHLYPDSNAWAANGPAVAGGGALLAGDPHLRLTLPSVWYQLSLRSADLNVTGASLPGMPAILIGHNANISWSITDTQNQSTFFYQEQTSPAHPNAYYWRGAWRPMQQEHYTVQVRGGAPVPIDVDLTVHGPVLTTLGQTTSVDWMGDRPSQDLAALLAVDSATDWTGFTTALRGWLAPTQTFVYADRAGNIGVIAPGYYAQVASGDPRGPLPGGGASDLVGTIPFAAVPMSYDPPSHVIASANQRPVSADYPYYVGPASGYDPGYRAARITAQLTAAKPLTAAGFQKLQNDVTDPLAQQMVPELLAGLKGAKLTGRQQAALSLLSRWNDSMDADSPAASVWWVFYGEYMSTVFQPWWDADKVPVSTDPDGLNLLYNPTSLMEDLQSWTDADPGNPAFTPPGAAHRDDSAAMLSAFTAAVSYLDSRLGGSPSGWTWGRLHQRIIPALSGAPALADGPRPAGGSPWTVDAADHGMVSDFGPSWRMVVAWGSGGQVSAQAVYPGGQSENPVSPWYDNLAPAWWQGRLLPLHTVADQTDSAQWTLEPGK